MKIYSLPIGVVVVTRNSISIENKVQLTYLQVGY